MSKIIHLVDKHPGWDAANSISIALAQSLGYIMKEEYIAYFCK